MTQHNTTQHRTLIPKLFLSSGDFEVTEIHLKEKTLSEILCFGVTTGK
jgi:hypothetical protein